MYFQHPLWRVQEGEPVWSVGATAGLMWQVLKGLLRWIYFFLCHLSNWNGCSKSALSMPCLLQPPDTWEEFRDRSLHACPCSDLPEKATDFPLELGLQGGCEPPCLCAEHPTRVLSKSSKYFISWTLSPAPKPCTWMAPFPGRLLPCASPWPSHLANFPYMFWTHCRGSSHCLALETSRSPQQQGH